MKKVLLFIIIGITIGIYLFANDVYALSNFTISGRLKDVNGNPLQGSISVYPIGAGNFTGSAQTDSNGNYLITALEGLYDIQYNINNFSTPFSIKFLSVNLNRDVNNFLMYTTEYTGKISLIMNSSENYTLKISIDKEPQRILINNSQIDSVSSILNLTDNKWFYNEYNRNLYVMPFRKTLPWLRVEGQWIVDELGRRTTLRGVGCSYIAYGNDAWLEQYCQWMNETGTNTIRLLFQTPNPDNLWNWSDQQNWYDFDKMNHTLNILQQHGIYAILGDSSPCGPEGLIPNYSQYWINNWVSIAQAFKNNPAIAAYELLNEPNGDMTLMGELYRNCTEAIRAVGDNHIVMCDQRAFQNASQILPNMMLDLHGYAMITGGAFAHETGIGAKNWFPEDADLNSTQFTAAEIYASNWISKLLQGRQRFNCPDMLGEYTAYNYSLSSPDVYFNQLLLKMCEQYGISWLAWSFDAMIQNVYGPNGMTFWNDFVTQKLGGPFTSNYVPSSVPWSQTYNICPPTLTTAEPQQFAQEVYTFPALPFNIWNYIDSEVSQLYLGDYVPWGPCSVSIPSIYGQYNYSVVFKGPCKLKVQRWNSGAPYWGTVADSYYIKLGEGETTTVVSNPLYKWIVVYAWE